MIYNGKEVYTEDTFHASTAKVGDYVEAAVVNNFMDCLPPACMRSSCSQLGEAYSMRYDAKLGEYRNTYLTFKRIEKDIWQYCGHCFLGENIERGSEPIWAI